MGATANRAANPVGRPTLVAGTIGYSYDEWKNDFYPSELPKQQYLSFYAQQLPAVEINNSFYRIPKPEQLAKWGEQVPDGFELAFKAPRRITHTGRLAPESIEQPTRFFIDNVLTLGHKLGPVLFQLPPRLRADTQRLGALLASLPTAIRPAFEFRHRTWFDDAVYDLLRERDAALCIVDGGDDGSALSTPFVATARWGYLRMRRTDYGDQQLTHLAEHIRGQQWQRAYVFFKHEDTGGGPAFARRLTEIYAGL